MQTGEVGKDAPAGAGLFLQLLKAATAPQHQRLESHPLSAAIVSPAVTTRQYAAYLLLMREINATYERDILPFTAGHVQVPAQTKASLLIAEDLLHVGHPAQEATVSSSYTVPVNPSVPFALGFRYVMEGSKLGGRVIFSCIRRHLGFSTGHGAGYFSDGGAPTAENWKTFLAAFSTYIAAHRAEDEAIQGAAFAFSSIYQFFETNRSIYAH